MKYIDAEKLKDEIMHLKIDVYDEAHQFDIGARSSLTFLESFIDSLTHEQLRLDIDDEIGNYYSDNLGFIIGPNDTKDIVSNIAKHFYELGINTIREE